MISNKIKIFADPSFQGGEAGPPDQMYKDQHPLHGAQLCQVGGRFFLFEVLLPTRSMDEFSHLAELPEVKTFAHLTY